MAQFEQSSREVSLRLALCSIGRFSEFHKYVHNSGVSPGPGIEEQAAIYWGTLAIGGPNLLTEDQMADILQRFQGYGQKR